MTSHSRSAVLFLTTLLAASSAQATPAQVFAIPLISDLTGNDWTAYPNLEVLGYNSVGDAGQGLFNKVSACTPDFGTCFQDTVGNYFQRNGVTPLELNSAWFGTAGNAQELTNCSITASSTTVTCSGYTFTSADVGKTASFMLAGLAVSGGRNATLNTTIASVSSGNAILGVAANSTVSSGGIFAFGTDDSTARDHALAATGPNQTLTFSQPGYLFTTTFKIGNSTNTWAHNIHGLGNPQFYCAINNHSDNCIERHAAVVSGQPNNYTAMNLNGGFTFDCLNNGLDCFSDLGGYRIFQENVFILNSYRNGWSRIVGSSDSIQQVTAVNTHVNASGLNAVFNWSASSGAGYIDEISHYGLGIISWSVNGMALAGQGVTGTGAGTGGVVRITVVSTSNYVTGQPVTVMGVVGTTEANGIWTATIVDGSHLDLSGTSYSHSYISGGMVAPSNVLGAAVYSINTGAGTNNYMQGNNFYGPTDFASNRAVSLGYGSDINPNAIFWADGRLSHVLWGSNASAKEDGYRRGIFDDPVIEQASGAPQAPGALFAGETSSIAFVGMKFRNVELTGDWANKTANIDLTSYANEFSTPNNSGNTPTLQDGSNYTVNSLSSLGPLSGSSLVASGAIAYASTLRSSNATIPVTAGASSVTDLTAFLGNNQGFVEVSGQDGSGNDFDDLVPWGYFGNNPDTKAVHGDTIGAPGTRVYSINPSTGNLAVKITSGSGIYTLRVSPFGGH